MKSIIVKAKKLPVGTVRKYGQSFYKKTASRGWQRVPTKEGRKLYEKQEKGKVGKKKFADIKIYKNTYYFKDRTSAKQWAIKNKWPIDRIISYKRGWTIQSGKSGNYAGPRVKPKQWEGTIKKPKTIKEPLKQKVKTPTKQPTRTKKTLTRMNVSNVTQQYIDKLKKIKIMNESGKKVYIKLVKRAIKNKDRKLLDQYLKEIDNWIKRDKKLREGKKKKMDWGVVR